MPGVCGLAATKLIRRITQERKGPTCKICILTADIEGLQLELQRRFMTYEGVVTKGEFFAGGMLVTSEEEAMSASTQDLLDDEPISLELVASKPVTFQGIQAIFKGFRTGEE